MSACACLLVIIQVPKSEDTSSVALKALLDREFGPPKFAVQKSISPVNSELPAAASASPSSHVEGAGPSSATAVSRKSRERASLLLEVIAGPAQGKVLKVAEDQNEVRTGRRHMPGFGVPDMLLEE